MKINEDNFIIQLINKNEKALDYIIDKYGWIINSIVKKHMYNLRDHQEECINDILLGIWNNIESFDESKNSFKNWIASISKYKTIDLGSLGGGAGSKLDDYTNEQVMRLTLFGLYDKELQDDVNIKIVYDKGSIDDREIEGPWIFEFTANARELALKTDEVKVDKNFILENGEELKLNKYIDNDLGQKIYTSLDYNGLYYDIFLKGHDDKGNEVKFVMSNCSMDTPILRRESYEGKLNAKKLNLIMYAAPLINDNFPNHRDYKQIGEEFTIDLK